MFRYGLTTVPTVAWVNPPDKELRAESKVHQLFLANQVGFKVPKTIFTNDPEAVREFSAKFKGKVVVKALYAPLIEDEDTDTFIFTSEMTFLSAQDNASISLSPFIVQEQIFPKVDYRVTVIEDVAIATRIESIHGAPIQLDWRTQKEGLSFAPGHLPVEIRDLCISYVKACGLAFGAIDLIEHDGNFFFLEINPNGEWGWLQKPGGFPIAEEMSSLLIRLDLRRMK
jgi:glutathione synthase/RimK-type ligase-like ATP-grasp enzyme